MNARTIAIGLHLFIAGWMFLNAFGHQAHVLWKWSRGTLRADLDLSSLLLIGAGLAAVSVAFALSAPALMRAPVSFAPAFVALGLFAVVIAAIARGYGFTFLGGSMTLATLELAALSNYALRA